MLLAALVLAGGSLWFPAEAAISQVTPSQGGILEPGDSATFAVSTDAVCIRASGDSSTYDVVADVSGMCGSAGEVRDVEVSVLTDALTPAGTYSVTVSETGKDGGAITWAFTVAATEPTSTTVVDSSTTTTTVAVSTTTGPPVEVTTTTTPISTTTTAADITTDPPTIGEAPATTSTTVLEVAGVTTTTIPAATGQSPDPGDVEASLGGGPPRPPAPPPDLGPEFSGLDSGELMALVDPDDPASLDGSERGFFSNLFGETGREQVKAITASGGWVWLWLFVGAAILLSMVGFVLRLRSWKPAETTESTDT